MTGSDLSAVTLRALAGAPLADDALRSMIEATARAIGERQGVEVVAVEADDESVTVTIHGPRIAAIGLAAELRRLTTRWYVSKYDADTLWGDADDGEGWKDAR